MQRLLIVGCSGSGKSTLGRRVGAKLGLPVVHMDQHFFRTGWEIKPDHEWNAIVDELVAGDSWVMDGNYSNTFERRIKRADTVIFLDFPTWFCVYRVLKRWLTHLGKTRIDAAPGCPEKMDFEFLSYVVNYNRRSKPKMLKIMQGFDGEFVRLKSVKAIDAFVAQLDEKRIAS
ncbi:adenylate kinase [Maritalea porphyrae]|uniref:Topology modulation protein n=1 Tax=Maritalea porphyrae TaxID=880732 RepID=A0ABQ5UNC5_9HYPH|nr:adenylate kinase [Maritalea porphyrae]GLQ15815.1 topology modulation protein [Maritalea porphyrae]